MKSIKLALYYPAKQIAKPITYHLIKDFNLEISILHADISLNKVGKLILDVRGEEGSIESALEYLQKEGIEFRLFSKSIIWQEDRCIHCGACTAVCPSGALTISEETNWSLTFDKEKCLVCELCLKTCPLRVMNVAI